MRGEVDLLGPAEIRELAARLGARPTKKLGQNFVHDGNTVRRIVAAAGLDADDVVVEVGPGLGSLTLALLPRARALHAVEVDAALAAELPDTVERRAPGYADRLLVHTSDALRLPAAALDPAPTRLVANLPYNVAVPVVLHVLATFPSLRGGLVMVQAEVADRLTAAPGSRIYGAPSVKLAWYAHARRAGAVPRAVFWPVPGVDSALVSFTATTPPPGADRDRVFALVERAFAARRKTLRAALASALGGTAAASQVLTAAGIDPATRGEALTVGDFATVAAAARTRQ